MSTRREGSSAHRAPAVAHRLQCALTADTTALREVAETESIKVPMAEKIARTIKQRAFTQAEAAALVGATQPDVSRMLRGDFRQFSVERLLRFLVALGHPVDQRKANPP